MRVVAVLGVIAISTISCQALGMGGGTTLLVGLLATGVAWMVRPGVAAAGGGGTGTAGGTAAETTTGDAGGTTGDAATTGVASTGTTAADAGGTTAEDGTATNATDEGEIETGACLSIGNPDPEMTVCLCACEQGQEPEDWAPAGLLPLIVLARSRRQSLDRIADQGRLPPDVVARLRERLPSAPDDEPRH